MRKKTKGKLVKRRLEFHKKEFLQNFGLWIAGIGINFIPLVCYLIRDKIFFWLSLDMFFICVSSVFILFLEFFIIKPIYNKESNFLRFIFINVRLILGILNGVLLLLYGLAFFIPQIMVIFESGKLNISLLVALLIFGFTLLFSSHIEWGKRIIKSGKMDN